MANRLFMILLVVVAMISFTMVKPNNGFTINYAGTTLDNRMVVGTVNTCVGLNCPAAFCLALRNSEASRIRVLEFKLEHDVSGCYSTGTGEVNINPRYLMELQVINFTASEVIKRSYCTSKLDCVEQMCTTMTSLPGHSFYVDPINC